MKCEFTIVDHGAGPSIRIEPEQPFDMETFSEILTSIPGLEIMGSRNVLTSFGPLETIDEIETSLGTISISEEIEGLDPCLFIYSDAKDLMTGLVAGMEASLAFTRVG